MTKTHLVAYFFGVRERTHPREGQVAEVSLHEKARCNMAWDQAKTTPAVARPSVKPKEDPLTYEMWLTGEVEHGPVEEQGAAEGLFLEELQCRGPQKWSGNKTLKNGASAMDCSSDPPRRDGWIRSC